MQTAQQPSLFDVPARAPLGRREVPVRAHFRRVDVSALPQALPHARGSETSREAAQKAAGTQEATRARVLACLRRFGPMTSDEVGRRTGLTSGTVCPRMLELRKSGAVAATGRRGVTASGGTAWIWEAGQEAVS